MEALKLLDERFAVINKQLEEKLDEFVAKRLDELGRTKNAL